MLCRYIIVAFMYVGTVEFALYLMDVDENIIHILFNFRPTSMKFGTGYAHKHF